LERDRDISEKVSAEINKISKDVYNLTELLTDPAAREGLSPSLFNSMLKNVTILEKNLKNTYYNTQFTYTDSGSSTVYYLTYDATNQDVYLQTSDTTSDYTTWTLVSTVVVAGQYNITINSNVDPYPYIAIDATNSTIYTSTMPANTFGLQDFRQGLVPGTSNYQVRGLATGWTTYCWTPASHPPSVGTLITLTSITSPAPATNQFQFLIS